MTKRDGRAAALAIGLMMASAAKAAVGQAGVYDLGGVAEYDLEP